MVKMKMVIMMMMTQHFPWNGWWSWCWPQIWCGLTLGGGIGGWHRIPIGKDGWSHIAAGTVLAKYKYVSITTATASWTCLLKNDMVKNLSPLWISNCCLYMNKYSLLLEMLSFDGNSFWSTSRWQVQQSDKDKWVNNRNINDPTIGIKSIFSIRFTNH